MAMLRAEGKPVVTHLNYRLAHALLSFRQLAILGVSK